MEAIRRVRQRLVAASRRHSRVGSEVEDLAHDIILAALRRGLALEGDKFARSADASTRQHSAFLARTAARRRAREHAFAVRAETAGADPHEDGKEEPPTLLPPALKTTLCLLCLGHTKSELRFALGITDAALRKRLQGLRERAPLARPQFEERGTRFPELRRAQLAQLAQLMPRPRTGHGTRRLLAVADGDGHGLIFSEALTNGSVTATTHTSLPDRRAARYP